jgi:hypothetical protein
MRWIVVLALLASSAPALRAQSGFTPATPVLVPGSPVLVPSSPALTRSPVNPPPLVTNSTLNDLSASLVVLQTNLQQILPILSTLNDNFDFVSLSSDFIATDESQMAPGNFETNVAPNPAAQVLGAPSQATTTIPITRDTLRALIVLQGDMQRMLPIVNALNGGATNIPGSFNSLFNAPATSP